MPQKPSDMAVMRGGFRDGWVYFEADLEQEQHATEYMGRLMAYAPTGRYEPHPTWPEQSCHIWQLRQEAA